MLERNGSFDSGDDESDKFSILLISSVKRT